MRWKRICFFQHDVTAYLEIFGWDSDVLWFLREKIKSQIALIEFINAFSGNILPLVPAISIPFRRRSRTPRSVLCVSTIIHSLEKETLLSSTLSSQPWPSFFIARLLLARRDKRKCNKRGDLVLSLATSRTPFQGSLLVTDKPFLMGSPSDFYIFFDPAWRLCGVLRSVIAMISCQWNVIVALFPARKNASHTCREDGGLWTWISQQTNLIRTLHVRDIRSTFLYPRGVIQWSTFIRVCQRSQFISLFLSSSFVILAFCKTNCLSCEKVRTAKKIWLSRSSSSSWPKR